MYIKTFNQILAPADGRQRGLAPGILFAIAVTFAVFCSPAVNATDNTLPVCLDSDNAPFSFKYGDRTGGTDLQIAGLLAQRLNRTLDVIWFEIEDDDEVVRSRQVNALLSAGICDLVPGYPFIASELAQPANADSVLPDLPAALRSQYPRGSRFEYHQPTLSQPYFSVRWGYVSRKDNTPAALQSLATAAGISTATVVNSMPASYLLRRFGKQSFTFNHHFHNAAQALRALADGETTLALVERHHFDRYMSQAKTDATQLHWTGLELDLQISFIMLINSDSDSEAMRAALAGLLSDGSVAAAFDSNKVHHYRGAGKSPLTTADLLKQLDGRG